MYKRVVALLTTVILGMFTPTNQLSAAEILMDTIELNNSDCQGLDAMETDIEIDSSSYYANIFADDVYNTGGIVNSGRCGDNLTWSIDSSGILTITGFGEMDSASWKNTVSNYRQAIKGVVLQEGLTAVCEAAFAECDEITEVIIPEGVHSIGRGAFCHCDNLSHIVIPKSLTVFPGESGSSPKPELDGVFDSAKLESAGPIGGGYNIEFGWEKEIPKNAFRRSQSGLKTIVFPEGIEKIGAYAFYECDNLDELILPDTVTTLGGACFYGCDSLRHIVVPGSVTTVENSLVFPNNDVIKTIGPIGGNYDFEYGWVDSIPVNGLDGLPDYVLISSKIKKCSSPPTNILGGLWNYKLTSVGPKGGGYNIEYEWTDSIPDYSFHAGYSRTIESVVIKDGIREIGNYSFYQCYSLSKIYLPASLEKIGDCAFYHGNVGNDYLGHGLKEIYYSGSAEEWSKIDKSGDDLNDVEIHFDQVMVHFIPNGGSSVSAINVISGQRINQPINPIRDGYTFNGWYSDPELTIQYDFTTSVTSDITLYAKWIKDYSEYSLKALQLDYADQSVVVEWGDDLFNERSDYHLSTTDYNKILAYASLYLCDQTQFSAYAAESALRKLGFNQSVTSKYYDDVYVALPDTPAYSIGAKQIDVNGTKDKVVISMAIRGTRGDWTAAADFMTKDAMGGTINGFLNAGKNTYDELKAYLDSYFPNYDKSDIVLFITGHSLGGATAGQVARMAINDGFSVGNTYAYTYAAPNYDTQNDNLSNYGSVFNVIHDRDIVPTVPWGYKRVGKDITYGKIYSLGESLWSGNNILNNHLTSTYLSCLRTGSILNTTCDGKHVSIHCPVDIEVYDTDNNLIARTNGENTDFYGPGDIFVFTNGDEKEIYSVSGAEYTIKMIGTNAGTMNYTVEYYDSETSHIKTSKAFSDVAITADKALVSNITENNSIETTQLYVTDAVGDIVKKVDVDGSETEYSFGDILPQDIPSDGIIPNGIWISGIEDLSFTGVAQKQDFRVYDGTTMLVEKTDYTASYKNNKAVYEIKDKDNLTETDKKKAPQVTIKMKGNYTGSQTLYFSILPQPTAEPFESSLPKVSMGKVKAAKIANLPFKGNSYTASDLSSLIRLQSGSALTEGTDYRILSVANGKNVGTATVVLQGLEASESSTGSSFTGQKAISFKIVPKAISDSSIIVNDGSELSTPFAKGGACPSIVLHDGDTKLKEGRDYTVKYTNNVKLASSKDAKAPTATIIGKGNYTGKLPIKYTITKRAFGSGITVLAADRTESAKAGQYMTKVQVIDVNGKVLKSGTDYEKSIGYFYDASGAKEVSKTDNPPAGTVIYAAVTGKGAYSNQTIYAPYTILARNSDISKAKFKVKNQTYTGEPVLITDQKQFDMAVIGSDTLLLNGENGFEIVPGTYQNNVKKGTAKVTLHGTGKYGGYKTVTYKITPRPLADWWKGLMQGSSGKDETEDNPNPKDEPKDDPNADPRDITQSKILVAYFSATGHTASLAEHAADVLGADLYEIVPEVPYTEADLAYYTNGRADKENADANARPAISGSVKNMNQYDTVIIGHPIWFGQAPKIIYTFLESYDFSNKKLVTFCTSASSSLGSSATNLHPLVPDTVTWLESRRFSIGTSKDEVKAWLDDIGLQKPSESSSNTLYIEVNGTTLKADLEDNSSVTALKELIAKQGGSVTVSAHDYAGFEKVGTLPETLPQNNASMNVDYGDVILYQGNQFVLYYGRNSYSLTKLGHVKDNSREELTSLLGTGDVTMVLSLGH